jgi:iron(III) transport system substrate-binding protein
LIRLGAGILVVLALVAAVVWVQPKPSRLSVLCSNNEDSCTAVTRAFEDRTGQRVSTVRMSTSEALARLKVPATRNEFDVWMGGPAESYAEAADLDLLAPIDDLASVAELPDAVRDPHGSWAGVYGGVLALCVNTQRVATVPRSWEDLLDPAYEGEVLMSSPLLSGTAATMLWVQYSRTGSVSEAMTYMSSLDAHLKTYLDSGTAVAHNVALGTAGVGISFAPYCEAERARSSAVEVVYPSEGTGYEIGAIGLVAGTQHRHVAREFIDFAVSDPGQRAAASQVHQSRTTTASRHNLLQEITDLPVPVFGGDSLEAAHLRTRMIRAWSAEVRHGTY